MAKYCLKINGFHISLRGGYVIEVIRKPTKKRICIYRNGKEWYMYYDINSLCNFTQLKNNMYIDKGRIIIHTDNISGRVLIWRLFNLLIIFYKDNDNTVRFIQKQLPITKDPYILETSDCAQKLETVHIKKTRKKLSYPSMSPSPSSYKYFNEMVNYIIKSPTY